MCWARTVRLAVKFACFQTEIRANGTLHFISLFAATEKNEKKKTQKSNKELIFEDFQSDALSRHTMFFAHKIKFVAFFCYEICNTVVTIFLITCSKLLKRSSAEGI
jgi:hypothetical protein